MHLALLFYGIFYCLQLVSGVDKYMNPEWKDTHAWADQKTEPKQIPEECQRTAKDIIESDVTRMAYKKLVAFLFDQESFKVRIFHLFFVFRYKLVYSH